MSAFLIKPHRTRITSSAVACADSGHVWRYWIPGRPSASHTYGASLSSQNVCPSTLSARRSLLGATATYVAIVRMLRQWAHKRSRAASNPLWDSVTLVCQRSDVTSPMRWQCNTSTVCSIMHHGSRIDGAALEHAGCTQSAFLKMQTAFI